MIKVVFNFFFKSYSNPSMSSPLVSTATRAGALLSRAESVNVQTSLAEALHIDTFDVRSGAGEDLTSTVVSVGKRLSSRATLSYEQSLDGLSQVVKVLYQLSPRVRLEAQAGQQSSFDAFYTREYD